MKTERLHLLVHILSLIVEPQYTKHPAIQNLGLNVARLEELTMDSLASFFSDSNIPDNMTKKRHLEEIFKLARHEEQYR
jgi:hypothetical protein